MTNAAAGDTSALRWIGSFVVALTLHVSAIGLLVQEGRAGEASLPKGIMLDLIALPLEPEVVPDETKALPADAPPPPEAWVFPGRESTALPRVCDSHAAGRGGAIGTSASEPAAVTTLTEWKKLLQRHLERYKQYPADALGEGRQGTPHVFFTVCRDGRVLTAHIVQSSGFASLDQAGMDLVRRAEPFPTFPQGLPNDSLDLVVPVEFVLTSPRR